MDNPNNRMIAAGRLEGRPELSHEVMKEPFYAGFLLVRRLSGVVDRLPVTLPGRLLTDEIMGSGALIQVQGQVRSYNKVVGGTGRLAVTLFVQHLTAGGENDTLNHVELTGTLCKPPVYRATPFGREICDLMLAVNRAFGKSDYIPCITWGQNAQLAARFHVGDKLHITGRLQSREYQKQTSDGEYVTRSALEVSCFTLEAESAAPLSEPVPPAEAPLLSPEELRRVEHTAAQGDSAPGKGE